MQDTRYKIWIISYGRKDPFFQQCLAILAHFSEAWARLADRTAKIMYTVQIAINTTTIKVITHD